MEVWLKLIDEGLLSVPTADVIAGLAGHRKIGVLFLGTEGTPIDKLMHAWASAGSGRTVVVTSGRAWHWEDFEMVSPDESFDFADVATAIYPDVYDGSSAAALLGGGANVLWGHRLEDEEGHGGSFEDDFNAWEAAHEELRGMVNYVIWLDQDGVEDRVVDVFVVDGFTPEALPSVDDFASWELVAEESAMDDTGQALHGAG